MPDRSVELFADFLKAEDPASDKEFEARLLADIQPEILAGRCGSALFFMTQVNAIRKDALLRAMRITGFLNEKMSSQSLGSQETRNLIRQYASAREAYYASAMKFCNDGAGTVFGERAKSAIPSLVAPIYPRIADRLALPLSKMTRPWIMAHRGSSYLYPENSSESFSRTIAAGHLFVETDVYRIADGSLVIMHDKTVDRTTDANGVTETFTGAKWKEIQLQPKAWLGYGYENAVPPTFMEALNTVTPFGVLVAEAKNQGSGALMVSMALAKGVQRNHLVVTSFSLAELAAAQAYGYETLYTVGHLSSISDWNKLVRAGVKVVGYNQADDDLGNTVAKAHAKGIQVVRWGLTTRSEVEEGMAAGLDGFIGSDADYIAGKLPFALEDTWQSGRWMPGMVGYLARGELFAEDGSWGYSTLNPVFFSTLQGWASPTEPYFTLNYRMAITDVLNGDMSRWGSVFVSASHDKKYTNSSSDTSSGYHIVLRANGLLQIYKKQSGMAPELVMQSQTKPLILGEFVPLKVEVGEQTVSASRIDTGETMVFHDSEFRGGYFHFGRAGAAMRVKDVVVDWTH